MIGYGRQSISQEDIEAVVEVLNSDFLTQGPAVEAFELALTEKCQSKHALAVCNGTAALHLACLALEIGKDDHVWVSAISFVASANAARYCGAYVDFVDISPENGLISIEALKEKLAEADKNGILPKALVVVHLAGQSCDMQAIQTLCLKYDIKIIEDACHALGGTYKNAPVGKCQFSDITVFSFHPVKPITSGEGGALLTNDDSIAHKARILANHGIVRDCDSFQTQSHGPWYYEMQELGFNYRLTDIQAALGLSQLKRLDMFTDRRRLLANMYSEALATSSIPVKPLTQASNQCSAYHLFIVRQSSKLDNKSLFQSLHDHGIGCQLHYMPIFMHPYYSQEGYPVLSGAMDFYTTALSLPLFPDMTEETMQKVLNALAACCR